MREQVEAAQSVLFDVVARPLDVVVEERGEGVVVHSREGSCRGELRELSLVEIAERETCTSCFSHDIEYFWQEGDAVGSWGRLTRMVERLEADLEMREVGPSVLARRSDALLRQADTTEMDLPYWPVSSREWEVFVRLVRRARGVGERVEEHQRSAAGRADWEAVALSHLSVEREDVDATPTLLGVVDPSRSQWFTLLQKAYEVHQRRGEREVSVLVLPRFAAEWALDTGREHLSRVSMASLRVGEESLAEVAAGLWEPTGEGALASLHAAVVASRKVVA